MPFDHDKLDVYTCALALVDLVDRVVEQMPNGRAHLKDQLDRATPSVVLNIAAGAGEFSPGDKKRFYRMARRSAAESAATLDLIARRNHAPPDMLAKARAHLERIVAMLIRMTQSSKKR